MFASINYHLQINVGPHRGLTVNLDVPLDSLDERCISDILIEKGYLNTYCNEEEYTVFSRKIDIIDLQP